MNVTTNNDGQKRYGELDSLRGLAALTVFFSHVIGMMIINSTIFHTAENSVLHIFWDGSAAVILFFVLSGFVLSLPYVNNPEKNIAYIPFTIRRVMRIYPAYICALGISIALMVFLYQRSGIVDLSSFVKQFWDWNIKDITADSIINHIIMIGPDFQRGLIDPIIWSLIVEMKISLVFPFFIYLIKKMKTIQSAVLAFIAAVAAAVISVKLFSNYVPNIIGDIVVYLPIFILGGLLAKFRKQLSESLLKAGFFAKAAIFGLGILLYTSRFTFHDIGISYTAYHYIIAVGVAVLITFCITIPEIGRFMTKKPIKLLGDISYSFYLLHFPVLMAVTSRVYAQTHSMLLSAIISLLVSIAFSYVLYKAVECPFMSAGRYLSKRTEMFISDVKVPPKCGILNHILVGFRRS